MIRILGGDGKEYGPVSSEQLHRWIAEGRVTLDTRARHDGEEAWQRLGDLAEFRTQSSDAAASVPPPVPQAPAGQTQTPVEKELPLASRAARLAAYLIDGFISMLFALPGLFMIVMEILGSHKSLQDITAADIQSNLTGLGVMFLGMLVPAVVQIVLLSLRGQSLGKMMLGIRIVRFSDEENPGFLRAVVLRSFVPGLIGSIPYLGLLFSLLDVLFIIREDKRCLHDHIADTKVVEKKA
jgi:uncharacterized RDD family membrane protein YckC